MNDWLAPIALAFGVISFLYTIMGQRNKVNDDYVKNIEKRLAELEGKVLECEKDRKLLREYIDKLTRPSKILLVEDDQSTRVLLERLTANYNREIVAAPDGVTALKLFEADNYDLVLLDINLPDMSGIEVFKKMKLSNRKANVVFISGFCDPKQLAEANRWGFSSFVLKPDGFNRGFMEQLLETFGVRLKA